jgi:hypothetical protein
MENILNKIDAYILYLQSRMQEAKEKGTMEGHLAQSSYANQIAGLMRARVYILEEI